MKIRYILLSFLLIATLLFSSCSESALDEVPVDKLSPENAFSSASAFDAAIAALHKVARDEISGNDNPYYYMKIVGTDEGRLGSYLADQSVYDYTQMNSQHAIPSFFWNTYYTGFLPKANLIIQKAEENAGMFSSEAKKNAAIAEAKFFRAYAHYSLVNLFGDVPLVTEFYSAPKYDFVRTPKIEVLQSVKLDLEFAAQWLPARGAEAAPGRITKGAANHLLTAVYLQLGDNESAIASATKVISGGYSLMTQRFGNYANEASDVFRDLFRFKNVNLAANLETIWALQYEYITTGGGSDYGARGNHMLRCWGANYFSIADPQPTEGVTNPNPMVVIDTVGRGVGWCATTSFMRYTIWKDKNDIRNSKYNILRVYTGNNPASKWFGKTISYSPNDKVPIDTISYLVPQWRKMEGVYEAGLTTGRTYTDFYKMRLAETYLLRAEAYMKKGDLQLAADDINKLRSRSKAEPVTAAAVTMDYILDERARELFLEEERRITLNRVGKLFDRTVKYNPQTGPTMKDFNVLLPIPLDAIQLNSAVKMAQNPGYN
ncbi:RagB/SusD family nutrient uptake outer membrane protein [Dyadobacter frigoris]|uniref:RagB/SusD family nutrient uptake outer membrane protein n=1 Tax=Dyadobacter frigoris TaxID=2576211 RepID=A0A4U6DB05_9BACT|nr:RagB/SusD family nutrient uptake outer membrane protein [Dyadobacter frigoris]TKT93388.1 RagB/SusD family nutrient uptake outer membrane protein [Dyadobacter frigoris]GLU54701.1 hypothetical protein Dfri01_41620 [Dyadobacter frigoris]